MSNSLQEKVLKQFFIPLAWLGISILGAFLAGAVLILLVGVNPIEAYASLIKGAFGSKYAISETLVKATPILLTGLAVAFAYRAKLVNLGVEGQLYIGAAAAAWLGLFSFGQLPGFIVVLLVSLGVFLAGGLYALIPGFLKAKLNVSEIMTGLMLNFVAMLYVSYLVEGPLRLPRSVIPRSPNIEEVAQLARILGGNFRFHSYFLVGVGLAILIFIIFYRTTLGFQLKIVGEGERLARFAGINVPVIQIVAMVVSGGIAALAGYGEVGGVHRYLLAEISPGFGYYGLVVAFLARMNPLGIIVSSLFFSVLLGGAETMQRTVGVPVFLINIIQGLVLFFVVGLESYRRKLEKRKLL